MLVLSAGYWVDAEVRDGGHEFARIVVAGLAQKLIRWGPRSTTRPCRRVMARAIPTSAI